MKVNIGKYPHWFTVSRLEEKYLQWRFDKPIYDIDEREYEPIDYYILWCLGAWQNVIHYTVNQIQTRRQQKVRVHVDTWDTWNADCTLAHVILPVLEQMKETKQGAPFVDTKDVPKELRNTKLTKEQKKNGDVGDKHFERWDYVLDAMIWSFNEIVNDTPGEEQFFTGKSDIVWTPVDENSNEVDEDTYDGLILYRLDKGPNDTREIDDQGLKAYNERIDYGLRMFGKYYRGLWD